MERIWHPAMGLVSYRDSSGELAGVFGSDAAECGCCDPAGGEYEYGKCPKHPPVFSIAKAARLAQLNGILRDASR